MLLLQLIDEELDVMTQTNSANGLFNIQMGDALTWNVKPLLHEVRHALKNLIDHGETKMIDLRSIPLAPGEEDQILATLGQGEVRCLLESLGPSEIVETDYAGVWLVTHYNDENDIISRFIEVSFMPEILFSQKEDVLTAYENLSETLNEEVDTTEHVAEKLS